MGKRDIKVGVFVLAGMLVTAAVIFLIGSERRLFESHVLYSATFRDVQGLKAGAPVRLSGVDIGSVTYVGHSPDANDDLLYVKMDIVTAETSRVRDDSIARVANKGLLGDKMLELTPGTPGHTALRPGSRVKSEDPADYTNLLTQVGDMAKKADSILTNLDKTTGTFAEDATRDDMRQAMHSLTLILNDVASGKGYVGRLLSDPAEGQRISHVVQSLDHVSARLDETVDGVNKAIARVNEGPGFAHDVLYSQEGDRVLARVGDVAGEMTLALKGVREGKGVAHGLLYGGDPNQQQIMQNLGTVSADLRDVMAGVKAGKGTVGGLLVDPSIYEDMKSVLGNVQRNDVLRALVRYSIKRDEQRPTVNVEPASGEKVPVPRPQTPQNAGVQLGKQ